jgi:hypothetical protein
MMALCFACGLLSIDVFGCAKRNTNPNEGRDMVAARAIPEQRSFFTDPVGHAFLQMHGSYEIYQIVNTQNGFAAVEWSRMSECGVDFLALRRGRWLNIGSVIVRPTKSQLTRMGIPDKDARFFLDHVRAFRHTMRNDAPLVLGHRCFLSL